MAIIMIWKYMRTMKRIKVKENQTLLDIALEYYANAQAGQEILINNQEIKNEPTAVIAHGEKFGFFYPDICLQPGIEVRIDEESPLYRKPAQKKMEQVTTYSTESWQET